MIRTLALTLTLAVAVELALGYCWLCFGNWPDGIAL